MSAPQATGKADPEPERGIVCPACECRHFWVIWTRHQDRKIVRRRRCRHCGRKVTTTERIVG